MTESRCWSYPPVSFEPCSASETMDDHYEAPSYLDEEPRASYCDEGRQVEMDDVEQPSSRFGSTPVPWFDI